MNVVDGMPRYFPTIICDKLCGYILASSIGMALFARERTGLGQEVHVAMMDAMVGFNMIEHLWGGVIDRPDLGLGYSRMLTPHRRPYKTSDGYISLLAVTDDQWRRLFTAMERSELAHDPRFLHLEDRVRHIDELYGIVVETIKTRTTAEWQERLNIADIPNGPVNDFQSIFTNEYLEEETFSGGWLIRRWDERYRWLRWRASPEPRRRFIGSRPASENIPRKSSKSWLHGPEYSRSLHLNEPIDLTTGRQTTRDIATKTPAGVI